MKSDTLGIYNEFKNLLSLFQFKYTKDTTILIKKKNKPNIHIECSLIKNLASGKYREANQPSKRVFAKYPKASTSDYLYKIWNNYVSVQIRNQKILEIYVTKITIQLNPLFEFKSAIHCEDICLINTYLVLRAS